MTFKIADLACDSHPIHGEKLAIVWDAPDNGGSPITSYVLEKRTVGDVNWATVTLPADALKTRMYEDTAVTYGSHKDKFHFIGMNPYV